jgi:putative tricarboxylic transport membrane protein
MEDKIVKKISIAAVAVALVATSLTATPANAATVAAAKAVVLSECKTVGEVAKGKGADGSDLSCQKATVGSMKGKTVWQYKTLPVISNLDIMIPTNSLTSGFGGFGKAIADAMKAEGLSKKEPVLTLKPAPYNLGLTYLNKDIAGKAGKLAVTGFAQVGGAFTAKSGYLASDATPAARMYAEYNAIAVRADSTYSDIDKLVTAIKANPKSMTVVGGTVGGVDTYTAAQLFDALNIDISNLTYVANNGKVPASLLSDAKYAYGISSYADFAPYVKAGTLKVLAVTSPVAIKGVSAPTLKASGINLVIENWRGILLPPNTSAAGKATVIRALDIVNNSKSYKDYLTSQSGFSNWMPGTKFSTWLKGEESKIRRIYASIGLL